MDTIRGHNSGSLTRSLAWLGGALATAGAVAVGAVFAVVFTATAVVVALMGGALLSLGALAMRAKRTARARASADNGVIEARHVGGHSWVAYGWNERR